MQLLLFQTMQRVLEDVMESKQIAWTRYISKICIMPSLFVLHLQEIVTVVRYNICQVTITRNRNI